MTTFFSLLAFLSATWMMTDLYTNGVKTEIDVMSVIAISTVALTAFVGLSGICTAFGIAGGLALAVTMYIILMLVINALKKFPEF